MVIIQTNHLTKQELSMVKSYSKFVLNKFVPRSVQNKAIIKINVVGPSDLDNYADIDDLKKFSAWVTYEGIQNDKKIFKIIVNRSHVNRRAKKTLTRMKKLLIDLGHELVHVKQYLNNEMFDYVAGGVRYKGSFFDHSYKDDEEAYYNSPWELEAYGREYGLWKMFKTSLKEEAKT